MITLTAKIKLANGETVDINKRNSTDISFEVVDRGSIEMPDWGVISNNGNLTFIDYLGTIKKLAETAQLDEQATVEVYLADTLAHTSVQVGSMLATDWDYDNDSRKVSVSLSDGLEEMQEIAIEALEYDLAKMVDYTTAKSLYEWLRSKTEPHFDIATFEELDEETRDHLEALEIAYANIEGSNLWHAWQDFGTACQLHIFKNKGKIVCAFRGGD